MIFFDNIQKKTKLLVIFVILLSVTVIVILFNRESIELAKYKSTQHTSDIVKKINRSYKNEGERVKIAIIDSGVNAHDDLSTNIKQGYNFITDKKNTKDMNGHGTLVAGVISAKDNKIGIKGVCPKAEIYPLVVLDEQGKGDVSTVCEAIEWCIVNNIDVINLSFATKKDDERLHSIVDKAIEANIIIVASYNNDKQSRSFPAEYEKVISVIGSGDASSLLFQEAMYIAPDSKVVTTNNKNGYEYAEGNSIATAYVTGVVALLKSESLSDREEVDNDTIIEAIAKIGKQ